MKLIITIAICFATNLAFSQTLFTINDTTQQIIVAKTHWYTNKITNIEKINCKDNELLYEFIVKLVNISRQSPLNVEIYKTIDAECRKQYSAK
jgi:aromatic ring-opening dioxygenase catalytic subunit (LigB family)